MTEKILNTRIQLKYDTWDNWQKTDVANKGGNLVLKQGEMAVTAIASGKSDFTTPPTIMFKVGDGKHKFSELPWASGLAADVYPWAKSPTAPVIGDGKITIKQGTVEKGHFTVNQTGDTTITLDADTDTNTQYQLVLTAGTKNGVLKLQSKEKNGTWTDVAGQSFTFEESDTNGNIKIVNGSVAAEIPVHGLGTAAYKADTYFATAESVSTIESSLEGAVEAGIADLNTTVSGMAAGKTLQTLTQTDGKIAATFQDISIAQSQVSGLTTALNGKQNNLAFEGTYNASTNKVATKSYVDGEIAKIDQFKYVVSTNAATTPSGIIWYNGSTAVTGTLAASANTEYTIYLVPCKHSAAQQQEGYDEYLTVKSGSTYSWEVLGNTRDIDLTGYVPTSRKVNNKALTGDITLGAADVGVNETAFPGLKKVGTVTGVKMNGAAKTVGTDGVVDLGTVITAHQDISGKQDKLNTNQLAAVNSGITAAKVNTYDGYATGKQDKLSDTQLGAVNSGITQTKVGTYDGYASKISALESKPGLDKVGTVTSVSTTANNGLKVTNGTTAAVIDIDDTVIFVLDCGSATVNV